MLSVLSSWIFWLYVCNVQKAQSVRIFENLIQPPSRFITYFQPTLTSKTCLLKPQAGPCRSKVKMWFYDPAISNCSTFDWGGCQGNGNRFDTFPDCWGYCMSKPGRKSRPRYCSLTFDYGYCFGAVERWYYDAVWKVCKSTIYSGCGGNKNNFYNQEQCDMICRFGKTAITTASTKVGGNRNVLIINPWNVTHRRGLEQTTVTRLNTSTAAG